MTRAAVSAGIDLPAAAVWRLMSDLRRFNEWLMIHDDWDGPQPDLALGAVLRERLTLMGISSLVEWTVTGFDPPRTMTVEGSGMPGARLRSTLSLRSDAAGATTVDLDITFTGRLMVGEIGAALENSAVTALETSLARLRDLAAAERRRSGLIGP